MRERERESEKARERESERVRERVNESERAREWGWRVVRDKGTEGEGEGERILMLTLKTQWISRTTRYWRQYRWECMCARRGKELYTSSPSVDPQHPCLHKCSTALTSQPSCPHCFPQYSYYGSFESAYLSNLVTERKTNRHYYTPTCHLPDEP